MLRAPKNFNKSKTERKLIPVSKQVDSYWKMHAAIVKLLTHKIANQSTLNQSTYSVD